MSSGSEWNGSMVMESFRPAHRSTDRKWPQNMDVIGDVFTDTCMGRVWCGVVWCGERNHRSYPIRAGGPTLRVTAALFRGPTSCQPPLSWWLLLLLLYWLLLEGLAIVSSSSCDCDPEMTAQPFKQG